MNAATPDACRLLTTPRDRGLRGAAARHRHRCCDQAATAGECFGRQPDGAGWPSGPIACTQGGSNGECTVGTVCDDGNACTRGKTFSSSCQCTGGTPLNGAPCGSGNVCQVGACTPALAAAGADRPGAGVERLAARRHDCHARRGLRRRGARHRRHHHVRGPVVSRSRRGDRDDRADPRHHLARAHRHPQPHPLRHLRRDRLVAARVVHQPQPVDERGALRRAGRRQAVPERRGQLAASTIGCELDKYGELKGLVAGTTSIVGAANPANQSLLRLAGAHDRSDAERARRRQDPGRDALPEHARGRRRLRQLQASGKTDAYVIHVAEGVDETARNEFATLGTSPRRDGCLYAPKTTIVHGTALGDPELTDDGAARDEPGLVAAVERLPLRRAAPTSRRPRTSRSRSPRASTSRSRPTGRSAAARTCSTSCASPTRSTTRCGATSSRPRCSCRWSPRTPPRRRPRRRSARSTSGRRPT